MVMTDPRKDVGKLGLRKSTSANSRMSGYGLKERISVFKA